MRFFLFITMFFVLLHSINAQTIVKQDGKFGLIDEDGQVVLKPVYDLVLNPAPDAMDVLFIIKQGHKYAFTYKVETDSTIRLEPEQVHWTITDFEFDSLRIMSIGTATFELGRMFTTIAYKQNGKWGMIYIETFVSSGGGIFPSLGFSAGWMGRLYRREARYDKIYFGQKNEFTGRSADDFYPTMLNGKYGLWDPMRDEEYLPEFDTIPLVPFEEESRLRKVKKGGKWGIIRLNKETKTIKYLVPCKCRETQKVDDIHYACAGVGDTIMFFDRNTAKEYVPLYNGKPLVFDSPMQKVWTEEYALGSGLYVVNIHDNRQPHLPAREAGYNQVYLIDPVKDKVTSYNEPGMYYCFYHSAKGKGLLIKAPLQVTGPKRQYDFYNMLTAEHRFSIVLDTTYNYYVAWQYTDRTKRYTTEVCRIYYFDKRNKKRTIGYYNCDKEKFTWKRKKCKV